MNRDLSHHFEEGRYCDGIFKAIAQVALQLERLFPRNSEVNAEGRPAAPGGPEKGLGEDPPEGMAREW